MMAGARGIAGPTERRRGESVGMPASRGAAPRRGESGYSLVELVLTITILAILSIGFGKFFLESTRNYDWTSDQAALSPPARLALSRLLREAAEIRSAASIGTMTSRQLGFRNLDGDSVVVSWSGTPGGNLTLTKNGASTTLAGEVDSLGISYYTSSGTIATLASQVWRMKLRLRLARGAHQVTCGSSVYVRNH